MDFSKKLSGRINELIALVLFIGILALINLIGDKKFTRFDLTAKKEYTISQSTKNILANLDDVINIKCYFSSNLPPMQEAVIRQIRDMLSEYRIYSKNRLQIEYIDPMGDDELKQSLMVMGIPELRLNTYEKDKAQVIACYMGMGVFYEDRKAILPVVINLSNFEYDLTASIRKVAMAQPKIVGLLSGYGSKDPQKDMMHLKNALEQQYELRMQSPTRERGFDDDITTLILAGPTEEMPGWLLYQIDQYLMRGGRLMILSEGMAVKDLTAIENHNGLNNLLASYKIRINKDLITDPNCAYATFSQGFMSFTAPYPFFVKSSDDGLMEDNPVTGMLDSITFPWASSIEILGGTNEVQYLVKSSKKSWTNIGYISLNPQGRNNPQSPDSIKAHTIAAIISGTFTSAYGETGMPKGDDEDISEAILKSAEDTLKTSPNTHILVIGDSDFIMDQHARTDRNNSAFFLNCVDWLTLDPELIKIRSRAITNYPLAKFEEWEKEHEEKAQAFIEGKKDMIRFGTAFGMPVFIGLLGFGWHFFRKKAIHKGAEDLRNMGRIK